MINIHWFRRDLRLDDNRGLLHALKEGSAVLPIFIFDPEILKKLESKNDQRVHFIYNTLLKMKKDLNEIGSDLAIYYGRPEDIWAKIIKEHKVKAVYTNEDYEPYAIKRDNKIEKLLTKNSIDFHKFKDHCIFAKNDVLKNDGKPYTVFTPYKNKWLQTVTPEDIATIHTKKFIKNFIQVSDLRLASLPAMGFEEVEYKTHRQSIKKSSIENYHETRDLPALDSTTRLGHHLRFGTISPRKCAQIGMNLNDTWLSEIIWREFFSQILYHFPHVTEGAFKEKYNGIKWINDKKQFKQWCEGKTGYAMVDAGMRELNATGFMHNRVRMVAASFLIKHLLIHWSWGEEYFAQRLLDFDLSSNNGNWQWVAGTGCDSAPYFRIFNPMTQLKKFDPELKYVKKWIPEYGTDEYPEMMIDHKMAYNRALMTYKTGIN